MMKKPSKSMFTGRVANREWLKLMKELGWDINTPMPIVLARPPLVKLNPSKERRNGR